MICFSPCHSKTDHLRVTQTHVRITPDYRCYTNTMNTNETDNLVNALNNLMYNFNNHRYDLINPMINRMINDRIDRVPPNPVGIPSGVPVVDGYITWQYVYEGWDENPVVVCGQLVNETNYQFEEEAVSVGNLVTVARPILPRFALEVGVVYGRKV